MTLEELYRLLRSSHVQAQGIVDTLQEPLVVLDQGLNLVNANPAFYRAFQTDRESTLGRSLFDLGNGLWDIAELRLLFEEVLPKSMAIVSYEVTREFPAIGQRTMLVSARTMVHPDSNSTQMLVVFEDVTARENSNTAKDILLAETRHRMKNLMAMVRAVAHQTEAAGKTGEQYRDVFMGRFDAILTAQAIIADETEADLHKLVSKVVEPIASSRCEITAGPAVHLTEYQITPLAMMLHELATNALKYGALSKAEGRIHIDWSAEHRQGQDHLVLNWREEGGPPVTPPTHKGFGMELIAYNSKAEGGDAELDFSADGLRVRITFPLGS